MKLKHLVSSLLVGTFATISSSAAIANNSDKSEVLTVEKLNSLYQVRNVIVAPDGDSLIYGMKKGTASADNHLYQLSLKSGKTKQLTSHKNAESNVVFSQDGNSIYFLSARSGSSQIWKLPIDGGEAQQVTNLPLDINGFKLSKDNSTLALSITVMPGCKDFQCTIDAQKADAEKKYDVRIYDQLMVRHWDVWQTDYKDHLFVASIPKKGLVTEAENLIPDWTESIAGIGQVTIHPNNSKLVFSAKQPSKDTAWTTNFDLFEVDLNTKQLTNITADNKAWDANPAYSQDGKYLAYKAMAKPGYESDKFALKLREIKTGKVKTITSDWDRSIGEFVFGDSHKTVYAIAQDVGQKSIFEISTKTKKVKKLYGNGISSGLSFNRDKLYFTRHALNAPSDIYAMKDNGKKLKQLTSVNKENLSNLTFGEFEQFSFKGWNDEKVHGYLVKPANYQKGKSYPMAFLVHGGPQGSFGNMFHYRWNAQLWAAQGYGVVMMDFHGSTGYGQEFTDSIAGDWGGKPLVDLQKGFDYIVKEQPWLDADNSCALGASYGGYMMNWISGHWPERFKCIVNHAGLYDMPSFYSSTEELWFPEHDLGGPVWEGSEDYSKFDPARYVKNWKTPMLVIQGELDYRVPYAQSLGAFTALQRQGIESRLVMFPTEDHHIRNPDNLIKWYDEVFKWMEKYIK